MKYEFTDDLITHHDLIDTEHRNLINHVNTLFLQLGSWETNTEKVNDSLFYLSQYVNTHFEHENALMLDYNHPEMTQHIAWHNRFKHNVRVLVEELAEHGPTPELVEAVIQKVELIIDHIKTFDTRLASHIQQKLYN